MAPATGLGDAGIAVGSGVAPGLDEGRGDSAGLGGTEGGAAVVPGVGDATGLDAGGAPVHAMATAASTASAMARRGLGGWRVASGAARFSMVAPTRLSRPRFRGRAAVGGLTLSARPAGMRRRSQWV